MRAKLSVVMFLFVLGSFTEAHSLQLAGGTSLNEGQSRIMLGFGFLSGVVSPPSTFSHDPRLNRARMFEEHVTYSLGLGNSFLKDLYLEIQSTTFQSREETVSGVLVHPSDSGWAMTLRGGGNFIHEPKWTLGTWLQSSIPIFMDKDKFVNPVLNYVGGGVNAVFSFTPEIAVSESVFLGSGLFQPRNRNPNLQSSSLGIFNLGQLFFSANVIFKTGLVVETDLASRLDADYQASALSDGEIMNLVFISPFLLNVPIQDSWGIEGGYAVKWAGKSAQGSQFGTLGISKKF